MIRIFCVIIFLLNALEASLLSGRKPKTAASSGAEIVEVIRQGKEALTELRIFYSTISEPKHYKKETALRLKIAISNIHYAGSAMLIFSPEKLTVSIIYGGAGITDKGFNQAIKFYSVPLPFMQALKNKKSILGFGRTHRGFYKRFEESWDDVYRKIRQFAKKQGFELSHLRYRIIGHSMGSGEAYIAAYRLALITFKGDPELIRSRVKVFTFGSPRAFDAALASDYNKRLHNVTYRFIHDGDSVIPKLPLNLLGYKHVGYEIKLPRPDVRKKRFHEDDAYLNSLDKTLKTVDEHQISIQDALRQSGVSMKKTGSSWTGRLVSTLANGVRAPIHGLVSCAHWDRCKALVEFESGEQTAGNKK